MKKIEVWAARDKNKRLYLYRSKPDKDATLWYSDDLGYLRLPDEMFPEVQWSDEEPTKVKIVIDK